MKIRLSKKVVLILLPLAVLAGVAWWVIPKKFVWQITALYAFRVSKFVLAQAIGQLDFAMLEPKN